MKFLATADQYKSYALITDIRAESFRIMPHHYLNYRLTPNFRKGLTSHNSLGYRNNEFPLQKKDGAYRIVALGGSSTYTELVEDNDKTFTSVLERLLRDEYGYDSIEVINAGVPGYNSWESLINLAFRIPDLEPDLVIIYHGTNDVQTRFVKPSAYRGDNSGWRKQWRFPAVPLWEQSCLLRILSRRLGYSHQAVIETLVDSPTSYYRDENPELVLKKNPPVYFQRNLENMIAIAKEQDIQIMLATWAYSPYFRDYAALPFFQSAFDHHNEIIREIATAHEVPMFDFAALMPKDSQYWADGRHVNEAGASIKGRFFAEFIHKQKIIPD